MKEIIGRALDHLGKATGVDPLEQGKFRTKRGKVKTELHIQEDGWICTKGERGSIP